MGTKREANMVASRSSISIILATFAVATVDMVMFAHDATENVKEDSFMAQWEAKTEAKGQLGMPSSIASMVNARNHKYEMQNKRNQMASLLAGTDEQDDDVNELQVGNIADEFTKRVKSFTGTHVASALQEADGEEEEKPEVKKAPRVKKKEEKVDFESFSSSAKTVKKVKVKKPVVKKEEEYHDDAFEDDG